jgi:hypothetical protein
MGNLKPGATYIYEKADGVTYAREFEADPVDRFPIGWDYVPENSNKIPSTIFGVPVSEIGIYIEMLEAAKTNTSLQEALDRAKLMYHLSKDHGQEQTRRPF